jgi:hypothetical protein
VGETIVSEHEVLGNARLRPESDVAAGLHRIGGGIGEPAVFDDRVRRLDEDTAASVKPAAPDRGAGADPAQRGDGIPDLERKVLLQDDVVDQVRPGSRALVLPDRRNLALESGRVALAELPDPGPPQRAEGRISQLSISSLAPKPISHLGVSK